MTFTLRGLELEGDTLGSICRRATLLAAAGPTREEQADSDTNVWFPAVTQITSSIFPYSSPVQGEFFWDRGNGIPVVDIDLLLLCVCKNKASEQFYSLMEVWKSKRVE